MEQALIELKEQITKQFRFSQEDNCFCNVQEENFKEGLIHLIQDEIAAIHYSKIAEALRTFGDKNSRIFDISDFIQSSANEVFQKVRKDFRIKTYYIDSKPVTVILHKNLLYLYKDLEEDICEEYDTKQIAMQAFEKVCETLQSSEKASDLY